MNELADARTFHGANAQTPTMTANICPRKMLTHLGKSEARSFADEIELWARGRRSERGVSRCAAEGR